MPSISLLRALRAHSSSTKQDHAQGTFYSSSEPRDHLQHINSPRLSSLVSPPDLLHAHHWPHANFASAPGYSSPASRCSSTLRVASIVDSFACLQAHPFQSPHLRNTCNGGSFQRNTKASTRTNTVDRVCDLQWRIRGNTRVNTALGHAH